MFWEKIEKFLTLLNSSNRLFFMLSGAGWGLILVPNIFWEKIGIKNIVDQNISWVWLFTITISLLLFFGLLFDLITWIKLQIGKLQNKIQIQNNYKYVIKNLSAVEKEILQQYIDQNTTTLPFDYRNGIVNGLVSKNILYNASQGSNPYSYEFDINMQPWVSQYLTNHPGALTIE